MHLVIVAAIIVSFVSHLNWEISLHSLEKRLADAENDVTRANLDERLASLDEMKNLQNKWKKNYQYEIDQLENEVRNIKLIADSLPEGCFKRARLEP